jgi:hypothetical protein
MFLVTVHLPNAFPFADNEVFLTSEDAIARANEWVEWGGARGCEVTDVDTYLEEEAARTFTAIGLGAVFGHKVVETVDATDELVAA